MFIARVQIRIIFAHVSSATEHATFLPYNICTKFTVHGTSRKSFPVGLDSDFATLIVRKEENEAIVAI